MGAMMNRSKRSSIPATRSQDWLRRFGSIAPSSPGQLQTLRLFVNRLSGVLPADLVLWPYRGSLRQLLNNVLVRLASLACGMTKAAAADAILNIEN